MAVSAFGSQHVDFVMFLLIFFIQQLCSYSVQCCYRLLKFSPPCSVLYVVDAVSKPFIQNISSISICRGKRYQINNNNNDNNTETKLPI